MNGRALKPNLYGIEKRPLLFTFKQQTIAVHCSPCKAINCSNINRRICLQRTLGQIIPVQNRAMIRCLSINYKHVSMSLTL